MRTLSLLKHCTAIRCGSSHPFVLTFLLFLLAFLYSEKGLAFHIECPPDVTVSCNDELWDLDIYGTATIYGYGDPQPAGDPEWVEYNLNSCNTGTIVRTWVAYDYGGNAYSCSQTIYVGGGGYIDIDWPPNYTLNDCSPGGTDPDDLPPPYDYPVIDDYGADCANVMYNYEDQVFEINPPACTKILRKWTVIDWCTYDPNDYHPQGIWYHTQIIKIVPENPPTIECPPDITVSSDIDCSWTYVNIPPATGMSDCGADVIITNHSPYATHGGADASGNYPPGDTWVTFKAEDGCGGYTTCKMKVTVKDLKKPVPICYYGISISLMQMPDGYYMELRPEFFDKGSWDNCTPKHKLKFDIEPKVVDCDDVGEVPVKVFVTDEYGNTSYCNTVVYVQDNMGMCPPTSGDISGTLTTSEGLKIEQVEVAIEGTSNYQMTNDEGKYSFKNMPYGESYTIRPHVENSDLNGVSTLDLLYFIRHIMGIEQFTSPYQYIAADLNDSEGVTANDMIALRDMILRNTYQLPTNSSWKFIDAAHQFEDPFNPFLGGIPDSYTIANLSGDMQDLNFIGVKLGDLSGDVLDDELTGSSVDVRSAPVRLTTLKASHKTGDEFRVKVYGNDFIDLIGYQFTLQFDQTKVEFLGVEHGNLPGLDQNNFGFSQIDEGLIVANWFNLEAANMEKPAVFSLKFKALEPVKTQEIISISDAILKPEAYTSALEKRPLELVFSNGQPSEGGIDQQEEFQPVPELGDAIAFPNPFIGSTSIGFNLSQKTDVKIVLYDLNGTQLFEAEENFSPGYHTMKIGTEDLKRASGILFCDILTPTQKKSIKLMVIDGP